MQKDYSVNYVSVVVPVYNEEGCLQELIDRTLKTLDSTGKKFEFILIDDGSRDSSREIITRASEKRPDEVIGCILTATTDSTQPSWQVFPSSAAT